MANRWFCLYGSWTKCPKKFYCSLPYISNSWVQTTTMHLKNECRSNRLDHIFSSQIEKETLSRSEVEPSKDSSVQSEVSEDLVITKWNTSDCVMFTCKNFSTNASDGLEIAFAPCENLLHCKFERKYVELVSIWIQIWYKCSYFTLINDCFRDWTFPRNSQNLITVQGVFWNRVQ